MCAQAIANGYRAPRGTRMAGLSHTSLDPRGKYIIPDASVRRFYEAILAEDAYCYTFTEAPLEHTPFRVDIDVCCTGVQVDEGDAGWRVLYGTDQAVSVFEAAERAIRELIEPASCTDFGGNTTTDATCDIDVLTRMCIGCLI
jgi:hypothetical protein